MASVANCNFLEYIRNNTLILDGASGTELIKAGMPSDVCPEEWVLNNPTALFDLQRSYIEAGSQAVMAFTFGANAIKLAKYGVTDVYGFNKRLAALSRGAAGEGVFVGGDIGPTGLMFEPAGELAFERAIELFSEQARGLKDGGADFIAIETMMDISEARCALIAAKEATGLPVVVSMTFEENGRTLTGSSPIDVVSALQAAGADAVGVNCSTGPDKIVRVVSQMKKIAEAPISAKPNAGMPETVDGKTRYSMDATTFKQYAIPIIQAGASLIGGCCGTDPKYIAAITPVVKSQKRVPSVDHSNHYISCVNTTLFMGESPIVISKSINPSNEDVYASIRAKNYDDALDVALCDREVGAIAMNISAYRMPEEGDALVKMAQSITLQAKMPVCFRSDNDRAIEYALRRYAGKAMVYPKHYETKEFIGLLPILNRYGALAVFSPHSYDSDTDVRIQLKHKVLDIIYMTDAAEAQGYNMDNLIINVTSGKDTEPFVKWCVNNGYKAAVDSQKLDALTLDLAIKKGATVIFADTRDYDKMEIVRKYIQ